MSCAASLQTLTAAFTQCLPVLDVLRGVLLQLYAQLLLLMFPHPSPSRCCRSRCPYWNPLWPDRSRKTRRSTPISPSPPPLVPMPRRVPPVASQRLPFGRWTSILPMPPPCRISRSSYLTGRWCPRPQAPPLQGALTQSWVTPGDNSTAATAALRPRTQTWTRMQVPAPTRQCRCALLRPGTTTPATAAAGRRNSSGRSMWSMAR